MSKTFFSVVALTVVAGCADDGRSFLVDTSSEAAGANCTQGGLRVDTGEDTNHDGTLDASEVTGTEYVCNGSNGTNGSNGSNGSNGTNGTSDRIKLTDEPAGTNCPNGGTRVDSGPDTNNNGTLDTGEIAATRYVCDGGVGDIVDAFTGAGISIADNTDATLQTATIMAPTAGTVFAVAHADMFCSTTTGTGYTCSAGTPAADICMSIQSSATAPGCTGDASSQAFAYLSANATESMVVNTTFAVAAGSTNTFYIRGGTTFPVSTGQVGAWRRELTLIYIPD